MLGEQHLRALSTTGACTLLACAGMCHLARQYWLGTTTRSRRENALDMSKRRFVERMWSLVTQDCDTENDLVKDLGPADYLGVYTSTSAVNPLQTIYLRRAPSPGAPCGFEWSVEKLVWLPTSTIIDDVLSIDHEILIRRLEAERLLTSSKRAMANTGVPITHPPELDLPQSLKAPESIKGDVRVPQEFRCPLGSGVMSQPVVAPSGLTYDRAVIEQWVSRFHTDPATGSPLQVSQLYPNLIIRDLIQAWMVSNAHNLDPAFVQRVTRDCAPGSYLTTPVSDTTPLAFDRTSSFGFGSEHTCSMALEGVSRGPASVTSATTSAGQRAAAQHSMEGVLHQGASIFCTASQSPHCQRRSEGGHCDRTPNASESCTFGAAAAQRRHSTALSGHTSTTDTLIPITSQQEFSPMGSLGFPAGIMYQPRGHESVVHVRDPFKGGPRGSSLPPLQSPAAIDIAGEDRTLSLSAASPLCWAAADATNTNSQETGCDTERGNYTSEKAPEASVAAGDVVCQQRLSPVKLLAMSDEAGPRAGFMSDAATGGLRCSTVVSPDYQAPRSWDSDEVLRAASGGVKLASSGRGKGSQSPTAAAALQGGSDVPDHEELDRLIA